jgi:nonsense-mediated mRNA decay protein 3
VTAPVYWRTAFDPLASVSDLVEFTVLDIEPSGPTRGKYVLSDAQVAPARAFRSVAAQNQSSDSMDVDDTTMGGTDAIYHTRTHLGAVLQPGDTALGYYLTRTNFNSEAFDQLDAGRVPDVVLVKKTFLNRRRRTRNRIWKLRSIAKEAEEVEAEAGETGSKAKGTGAGRGTLGRRGGLDAKRVEEDYEHFLRDLEEDPELRSTINLYRADVEMPNEPKKRGGKGKSVYSMDAEPTVAPIHAPAVAAPMKDVDGEGEDEADFPEIQVDELLDHFEDLAINEDDAGVQQDA